MQTGIQRSFEYKYTVVRGFFKHIYMGLSVALFAKGQSCSLKWVCIQEIYSHVIGFIQQHTAVQTPEKYRPACALNCLLTNDLILLCVKIEDNLYQDLIFDFTTKTLDLEMPWGISRLLFCLNYYTGTYLFKKIEISRHSASDCMYIPSCSENNDRRNI